MSRKPLECSRLRTKRNPDAFLTDLAQLDNAAQDISHLSCDPHWASYNIKPTPFGPREADLRAHNGTLRHYWVVDYPKDYYEDNADNSYI